MKKMQAKKIKKLTWFAAFCSLLQYTRERKLGVYLLANVIGFFVPALLTVLVVQGHIHWMAFAGISLAARLVFAPLDAYSSDEYAYCKLSSFPLNFLEMLHVRLVAKVLQLSEWLGAAATVYVFIAAFGGVWGAILAALTLVVITLAEELLFYLVHLVKNVKLYVAAFELACIALGVLMTVLPAVTAPAAVAIVLGVLLAVCIAATVLLHTCFDKLHVLPGNAVATASGKAPLSTRLMIRACRGSVLKRLVCMEWVCMLKLKVWNLISALGYVVMFSILDKSQSLLYVMVQYFIVDYCFLVGFNYFANINDREGMVLFSTVDVKTQLRSKHLALGSVLLAISSLLTVVLGAIYAVDVKTLVLTVISNLFSISMMLLVSGIVSITHFHLEESKKKYSVSNVVIMLVVMVVNSVLAALLLAGGALGAVSLIFMAIMTLVGLYFSLVDMSVLEKLYRKHQPKMLAALQN